MFALIWCHKDHVTVQRTGDSFLLAVTSKCLGQGIQVGRGCLQRLFFTEALDYQYVFPLFAEVSGSRVSRGTSETLAQHVGDPARQRIESGHRLTAFLLTGKIDDEPPV